MSPAFNCVKTWSLGCGAASALQERQLRHREARDNAPDLLLALRTPLGLEHREAREAVQGVLVEPLEDLWKMGVLYVFSTF